ncbi:hypothetical protein O206_11150 [Ochrobactrum sp. EGD-AQ16]|nr:hypothetical protein O206_11150 [Ochrobactrum sp. EGD-AQ16]
MKALLTPFKIAGDILIALEKLLVGLLNTILQLVGMKPMPTPDRHLPQVQTTVEDVIKELNQPTPTSPSPTSDKLLKPTSEAGFTLYRYACAQSLAERSTMDLSALSDDQQDWLLMLSDADLARLAKVGIEGCSRTVAGKRCGVGGLPKMNKKEPAEMPIKTSPLAEKIHAYRLTPSFA